jgi:hypothetical protein
MANFPSLGFEEVIHELVAKRDAWLNQFVSGQTVLHITVRSNGKRFYGIYKKHNKTEITVEVPRIDGEYFHLLNNQQNVISEDATLKFVDIEIKNG